MFKILLIEDDKKIRRIILERIEKWGFEGIEVIDFEDIFNIFLKTEPHLVLIDINLPYYDGFHWCNQIREVSKVPIIFITSRDSNMDIIMAMNMGGDDYINKPFSLEVLMAKIKAILRRTYSYNNNDIEILEHKGIILNLKNSTITYNQDKIELSKNEFKILTLLLENVSKIVSRDRIMEILWEDGNFIDDNTLTVNINRLRKRLSEIGLKDFVETKRGQGYMIP
ncbi:MAG: response regulator transcription factor [Halanaerobiales bacterium]